MNKTEEMSLLIDRLSDSDKTLQRAALDILNDLVRSKTPIHITYLDNHISTLEELCCRMKGENKMYLSDILSVLFSYKDRVKSINYRVNGSLGPIDQYGHHYVRQLLIGIVEMKSNQKEIKKLSVDCIDFLFRHNLELDAIDFIDEMKFFAILESYVDDHNYDRITLYLAGMARYNSIYNKLLFRCHIKMRNYAAAFVYILKYGDVVENDDEFTDEDIKTKALKMTLNDLLLPLPQLVRYQLIFMAARTGLIPNIKCLDETEKDILKNAHVNRFFSVLVSDLQIEKPRDIYDFLKGGNVLRYDKEISVRSISPICIANAFVHLGFCRDTIFCSHSDDVKIEIDFKSLDETAMSEQISIFASIGAINIFNEIKAISALGDLLTSVNSYRRTGALLGLAMVGCKIKCEDESTTSLLIENLAVECAFQKVATLFAMQLIYCHTNSELILFSIREQLCSSSPEVAGFAAFTVGSVFAGSANLEVATLLLDSLLTSSNFSLFSILGISLIFLRNPKNHENILTTLSAIGSPYFKHVSALLRSFAYLGSGDTELINELFSDAFEEEITDEEADEKTVKVDILNKSENSKKDTTTKSKKEIGKKEEKNKTEKPASPQKDTFLQSISMLGMCVISLGDELCKRTALRVITSATIVDNAAIKSVVPLCIALLSPSNPAVEVVDTVSKLCNCNDQKVVINSIIALGVIGAGTNNAHIAHTLEVVFHRYVEYAKITQVIRVAQGLLFMGKGTATLSPFFFNSEFLSVRNFVGLFSPLFSLIDSDNSPLLSKFVFLNYFYVQASSPKYVICVDDTLAPISVTLNIGEPVNVVGVVGRPKKITGIQTHNSPVLIQANEVVELSEESSLESISCYFEDIVVVVEKKNVIN